MTPPSIKQFNAWSAKDKTWWINYETDGSYKGMTKAKGYFPLIMYPAQNVGIVYTVDDSGNLTEATAMTMTEAMDRMARFKTAIQAAKDTNRFN